MRLCARCTNILTYQHILYLFRFLSQLTAFLIALKIIFDLHYNHVHIYIEREKIRGT